VKFYGYWRSTASYRVRIVLALKGLHPEQAPVDLARNGGENLNPEFLAINPQGRVPALKIDDGTILLQSPAIIEYLEERYPNPPLLPSAPALRARVRAVSAIIGCDINPLHNSSQLSYLRTKLGASEPDVGDWVSRWVTDGLNAVEALIDGDGFCFGPQPSFADIYLVPLIPVANRFAVSLNAFPKIVRVATFAADHPAFAAAHPSRQPDAE
jgi:maleylacetoacetate isomerase